MRQCNFRGFAKKLVVAMHEHQHPSLYPSNGSPGVFPITMSGCPISLVHRTYPPCACAPPLNQLSYAAAGDDQSADDREARDRDAHHDSDAEPSFWRWRKEALRGKGAPSTGMPRHRLLCIRPD